MKTNKERFIETLLGVESDEIICIGRTPKLRHITLQDYEQMDVVALDMQEARKLITSGRIGEEEVDGDLLVTLDGMTLISSSKARKEEITDRDEEGNIDYELVGMAFRDFAIEVKKERDMDGLRQILEAMIGQGVFEDEE